MRATDFITEAKLQNVNSLGRPIAQSDEALRNFWAWFKGSKVVDANRRPMVMYHGTGADFAKFGYEYADVGNSQYGMGFYFTNVPSTASGYAQGDTPNVMPVYLRILKPMPSNYKKLLTAMQIRRLLLKSPILEDALSNYGDVSYYGKARVMNDAVEVFVDCADTLLEQLNMIANDFFDGQNEAFLKGAIGVTGFDGVVHEHGNEIFYIAWSNSEIKSVVGNRGGYNREHDMVGESENGMLLRELFEHPIDEAISLTTEKHRLTKALSKLDQQTIGDLGFLQMREDGIALKTIYGNRMLSKNAKTKVFKNFLIEVMHHTYRSLEVELGNIFTDIVGSPVKALFKELKVGGSAGYDYVTISVPDSYQDNDRLKLQTQVSDAGAMAWDDDSNTARISDIDEVFWMITHYPFEELTLMKHLHDLVPTKIHELVHIKQHLKQSHRVEQGKRTEYRSPLANKSRFYQAINNIHNGNASEEDLKIYYASLQEIPAHAHNAALDLIATIWFPEDAENLRPDLVGELYHSINQLINLVKKLTSTNDSYNTPAYYSSRIRYYNKTYNVPDNPTLYSIYKRFIKLVYQELVNYINYWKAKIPKQKKMYIYDVTLNNRVIDTVANLSNSADSVRDELINHDNYDPNIIVTRRKGK